ncbi:MAG TPA: pimeloyl-[acyl-carrier protein] methyl ester esterase [Gammaproteobacteria bacterium]|nr:pimeloyl-[acyl-carrier protein] methyl ester esterase [Gammaproteobacteria bacterium]
MLYSETSGNGADLVMLHGWGMHSAIWGEALDRLSARYRVTTVDLPGHGRSPALTPPHATDLSRVAAAVAKVVPERAAWLGWSLGGLVAMQAALAFPARVSRLILVATNASFVRRPGWLHAQTAATLDGFAAGLHGDYRAVLQRFLALQAWGSEDARRQVRLLRERLFLHGEPDPQALAAGLTLLKESDLCGLLAGINQPVLLVAGENDGLVPSAALEAMARLLPDARLEQIPGAGHAPFLSHPARFEAAMAAFFDE